MTESTPPVAVRIQSVGKRFVLSHQGTTSLKERLIARDHSRDEAFWALRDVSFDIASGETFGLLGHNGSGKSTLLKCIARTLTPTEGSILVGGRVGALLELGAGFHPELSGRENVELNGSILGLSDTETAERMGSIFGFAELERFADTPVKHYSSGMFARLGFSVAMHMEPDILLVDEVLAVGDESFQRKCMGEVRRLQREGCTIVVVTHSADVVRQLCDRAAVLDHGQLAAVGDPATAIRTLRELSIERGLGFDPDLARAENLVQSTEMQFTDVAIVLPPGKDHVDPGDELRVVVRFKASDPTDNLAVALEVHDQGGNRLLGLNTDRLGSPPGLVDGEHEMVFVLESVPLLDGIYTVSVGLHDHDVSVSYDHREAAASFVVQNPTPLIGRVHIPTRVEWR